MANPAGNNGRAGFAGPRLDNSFGVDSDGDAGDDPQITPIFAEKVKRGCRIHRLFDPSA